MNKLRRFTQRVASVWDVPERDVAGMLTGARPSTVRVNRLHPCAPADWETEPVPWCADAYWCTDAAAAIPLAHEGKVYLQNASSLIPVVALDPRPGESIVDTAAAPGGKAFHIAARVRNDAELWLNDAVKPRAEKLRALASLYHVRYTRLTTVAAQYLDKELPHGCFDRILLDVQCSGEGRVDLRRPDGLRYWSEERIEKYKYLQTRMLDAAYRLLRPGGTMVYSTCTIAPEENEYPVSQVLRRHADLDVVPLPVSEPNFRPGLTGWRDHRFDPRLAHAVRVLPTDAYEGFFAARLVKT
ncbi:MAG: RsmB/NOP family class I SAM-dependent RNA methyltransferase [Actinobacteria bacterium]|nr:MAG: RsmB/NOP family class I SAM-dependent RNA methyltransferase [Actinomycetota bacterium]